MQYSFGHSLLAGRQPCRSSSVSPCFHHGARSRRSCRLSAVQQHTEYTSGLDFRKYQQQGGITWQKPDWHLNLSFRSYDKGSQLQSLVHQYYDEVMNHGCVDLLSELAAPGVTYSDALGFVEDAFGVRAMQTMIQEFQATHPLLRYRVDDVIVDEARDTVVVHYTATAAHLLPSRDGASATGHVSTVQGMDKFRFDAVGLCTSIQSYRQRFADEEDAEELQLTDGDL